MLTNNPTTVEYQEHYVLALIKIVLSADRPDFEITTGPTMLYGNALRGIRTTDIYALLSATPEQRAQAHAVVMAEIERRRLWWEREHAAELATKQARGYPY